jgi:hypothetical protein
MNINKRNHRNNRNHVGNVHGGIHPRDRHLYLYITARCLRALFVAHPRPRLCLHWSVRKVNRGGVREDWSKSRLTCCEKEGGIHA